MELFSVTCITCRAQLKVRHPSAIGQILPCPRCNGMVQITPPSSWTPPAKQEAAEAALATPPLSDARDEAALIPPSLAVAPGEARLRRLILGGGALVAAVIIGFGIWSSFGGPEEVPEDVPKDVHDLAAATSITGTAAPSASSSPAVSPSATRPKPSASPASSSVATATPSARPPLASASASATAPIPKPTPTAPQPTPSPTPTAAPTATKPPPVAPPPMAVPPPMIDLAARLQDRLPELTFDKVPLKQALALLSQFSTIRISFDWDSLADATTIDRPVSVELHDLTIEAAITKVLSEGGLEPVAVGDQLLVGKLAPLDRPTTVDYAIDGLTNNDAATAGLVELVQDFVAPETWKEFDGAGTIAAAGTKLTVVQTPAVHRELSAFLDRLRLARRKTAQAPQTTLVTRLERAREMLMKPVTMNYRPGNPLETVLSYLESATDSVITVDYLAVMSAGFQGTEPIGCAADKHPLVDVLTALCGPREWAWRVVGERTIDVTTREALRRRPYVEYYKVPAAVAADGSGAALVLKIRAQLADEGWRANGGRGEIAFDEPSNMLIVRQHQEAHYRIEKFLAELTPAPAPKPTGTP